MIWFLLIALASGALAAVCFWLDDDLWLLAGLFLSVVALVSAIGSVAYPLDVASCERQADRLGTEYLHDLWGEGCYLQMVDGRFVPADRYRTVVESGS